MVLNKTSWEIVAYVQVIFFAIMLIGLVVVVVQKWTKGNDRKIIRKFGGYFGLFTICKVAGGICGIILLHQSQYSSGLTMATYILDNISLGILIKCVLPFLELMVTEKDPEALQGNPFKYDNGSEDQKINFRNTGIGSLVETTLKKNLPFRLLTLVILAAVICTIVGSSNISSDGNNSGTSPMKAGSILFLVLIVLMGALIIWGHSLNKDHQLMAKILLVSIIFYIIRSIYSILSSFAGINFENPSKYLLIFGQYQYYTFMGFLEECIISITLLMNLIAFHSTPVIQ
mmetsp:Transcript_2269/g.2492  ORF Transcript_2269/g.2492 Transcript_2269/m.2492 type:complete len:287 (-) Transcript_2269:2251-3111(-)